VVVEIKHRPELALIHHLAMEDSTVVHQIQKQQPNHAIFNFVQKVRNNKPLLQHLEKDVFKNT